MFHREKEKLLNTDPPLLSIGDDRPIRLSPGQHTFPFTFSLPSRLAYSQKHFGGSVTYKCKARAISHSFWSFNGRAHTKFRVLPHRDLSEEPRLARPVTVQRKARSSLFSRDPGPFQLRLSRQGFVAGEVIDVWLDGPDRAFEVLAAADQMVHLNVRVDLQTEDASDELNLVLVTVRPGRSPSAWRHIQLTVPKGEVSMGYNSGCTIISVTHYVKVWDMRLSVILGTVPPVPEK